MIVNIEPDKASIKAFIIPYASPEIISKGVLSNTSEQETKDEAIINIDKKYFFI